MRKIRRRQTKLKVKPVPATHMCLFLHPNIYHYNKPFPYRQQNNRQILFIIYFIAIINNKTKKKLFNIIIYQRSTVTT